MLCHSCGSLSLVLLNIHFPTPLHHLLLLLHPFIANPRKNPSRNTQDPISFTPCSLNSILKESTCRCLHYLLFHQPHRHGRHRIHRCFLRRVQKVITTIDGGGNFQAQAHPLTPWEMMKKKTTPVVRRLQQYTCVLESEGYEDATSCGNKDKIFLSTKQIGLVLEIKMAIYRLILCMYCLSMFILRLS